MARERTTKRKLVVTEEHKAAMAQGRNEGRVVRTYLELLESSKRGRGRPRTPERIEGQLATIEELLPDANGVERLELLQQRMNLQAELAQLQYASGLEEAEAAFVDVAKSYSERKGISWAAWREAGVSAEVLRRAGLSRRYEAS